MFDFVVQRPYLQFALALACGTALGGSCPPPLELLREWWLWLTLAAALGGLWWEWRARYDLLAILPGLALLVLIGFLNAALASRQPAAQPLRGYLAAHAEPGAASPMQRLSGQVASLPKYQNGHLRFMLRVEKVRPWVRLPRPIEESAAEAERPPVKFPDWSPAPGLCYLFVRCAPPPAIELGDRVQLSATLEEVLPPRNFGQFDYRAYLQQRGTVLTAYAPSAASIKLDLRQRNRVWLWLSGLRSRLIGELQARLSPGMAELAIGTVYGDKITEVSDELSERFRRAGLSHILVASGTQVSLLIALLLSLGWRNHRPALLALRSLATLLVVLVYASLAGLETSIIRALVMGGVVLATRLLRRDADGLSSLAQAALILLALSPLQLFSAGFQLSFAATFGLIYLNGITLPVVAGWRRSPPGLPAPALPGWRGGSGALLARWQAVWPGWRAGLLAALSTTVGAQIFVVPVLACQFHQLSLWGLASNAVAVPLSFLLLVGGALLSFGLGVLPLAGAGLEWSVELLSRALDGWAALFAGLPGSDLAVPALPGWQLCTFYGLLFVGGEWVKACRAAATDDSSGAEVPARWLHGPSWAVLACSLALASGMLSWLLIPRPELAALALPGSTAYLWIARDGAAWLLVSPTGLTRHKNAETLLSGLRARGLNRLHGLVWLGPAPAADPLPDIRGPRFDLAHAPAASGKGLAPHWLAGWRGRIAGAALPVGKEYCIVAWDSLQQSTFDPAPAVVLATAAEGMDELPEAVARLATLGRLVVLDPQRIPLQPGPVRFAAGSVGLVSGRELRLRPAWGDKLSVRSRDD